MALSNSSRLLAGGRGVKTERAIIHWSDVCAFIDTVASRVALQLMGIASPISQQPVRKKEVLGSLVCRCCL